MTFVRYSPNGLRKAAAHILAYKSSSNTFLQESPSHFHAMNADIVTQCLICSQSCRRVKAKIARVFLMCWVSSVFYASCELAQVDSVLGFK